MKTVVISLLGTSLDNRGFNYKRWERWRPTLSLCQHDDLLVDRLELLFQSQYQQIAENLTEDIRTISPETEVRQHLINLDDPWDFQSVYAELLDFAQGYAFNSEQEQYLVHITTGTHVAQICLYLLTEARYLPGRLVQTSPPYKRETVPGHYQIIDLDLSKYDQLASRFAKEHQEGAHYLKGGIETRNPAFNKMIEQVEKVAIRSQEPILLTGPSGSGKSQLAKRIYQLKKKRGQFPGALVEVNCATLRGDNAMSALFGHVKGAFTGAVMVRKGLLAEADNGLLFLDEIGELGLDEQAMLLRAIEDKRFMPLGSDKETSSRFQLIAGTNRNLFAQVEQGRFREDLLARINLWSYQLPSLKQRLEDLDANIDYELEKYSQKTRTLIGFNKQARECYLQFAKAPEATWNSNFRDLNASITRMATLADGGRITLEVVAEEIDRLRYAWRQNQGDNAATDLAGLLDAPVDLFDQAQLAYVIRICQTSHSAAEAGRKLFNVSRQQKASGNDSHRLIQFLSKFGLDFKTVKHYTKNLAEL
ncbi:RNA repair transcriptional activator RtcR [Methylovulum psychrotolerans]|uniref:RNA repair transcriptional activator RtcR n=1 Tax=Methylovulum psychrotolerans TaxID=1704499 RepID=UPI001BFFB4B5|nr:RNA repair transcriptional activator RtcR [Methylovulum psychrotolerans]MBT9099474.1 RNA repair transcriptional activator RtcR [Methylovulum psychrotolerans]